MNKKVLLLTTIYPAPDLEYGTPTIHYFTKEWIKMGYEVRVVHSLVIYPRILYFIARMFRDKIASFTGAVVFKNRLEDDNRYQIDNVTVWRFPIFKWVPYKPFTKKVVRSHINKIIKSNLVEDYHPNFIIGHFSNPHLEIVSELKNVYNARTAMIMHDTGISIRKIYGNRHKLFMDNIDVWGYRSIPIKNAFEDQFGRQKESFLCYSGIPGNYITQGNTRCFKQDLGNFVYVGELIRRKHPSVLIKALNSVYPDKNFHISFLGRGYELNKIKALALSLELDDNVSYFGHTSRKEVFNILDESDCMIMISENETFGLVYLEAMGRGCITIGSKGQGIDGVIVNGINGFLCDPGSQDDLANIIKHINDLSPIERRRISVNAIETVNGYTDSIVARNYILEIDKNVLAKNN